MVDLPPNPPESPPPDEAQRGFKKLSRQIARRTTDLIGVALLAIGLLAVGGKIGRWWNTDPPGVAVSQNSLPALQPWDAAGAGVSLEWGDLHYVIHHQTLSGDATVAGEQLEKIALTKYAQVATPAFQAADAEKKLLTELEKVNALRELEAGGRLYRFGPELPMVILTKPADSDSRRVVCWGRAFPQSDDRWMVFLFYTTGANASPGKGLTIPLPEGCRNVQRMQDASGQSWTGFRGTGSLEEGQRHFDRWFRKYDWRTLRGWSKTGSAWTVRFQSLETELRADIWLSTSANGSWEGMIFLSPIDSEHTKK